MLDLIEYLDENHFTSWAFPILISMLLPFTAPIHSQATITPIPVRPFQQQPPHISFQDPFPLKSSEHSVGTTSHGGRVGSALGMVNPSLNSPTDCHSSQASHSHHGVGKSFRSI